VGVLAALVAASWRLEVPGVAVGPAVVALLALTAFLALTQRNETALAVRRVAGTVIGVGRGLVLALLPLVLWIHLAVFDRAFLADGRVGRRL
jgi:hypothetical protein